MFKAFGKGDGKEQTTARTNSAEAANAVTAQALRSLNPRDKDLTDRLELKKYCPKLRKHTVHKESRKK